jgi:hypothetical protein
MVPTGKVGIVLRLCAKCARTETTIGDLGGDELPLYDQDAMNL